MKTDFQLLGARMSPLELKSFLDQSTFSLPVETQERILRFYELVRQENEIQNLTKLVSPQEFYEGHVLDVLELLKFQKLEFPAVDLGSGVGVPGLLAALIEAREWVLIESERRKAEYLDRTVNTLNLSTHVQVFSGRIEDFLRTPSSQGIRSIVARAVGPVERIYSWIRKCSTWNTLVLFKGPGWTDEWERFKSGKMGNELQISSEHSYTVGSPPKSRRIVFLTRVPRGTKNLSAR